jgi:branched-chain amino acid transport system substrate-binding protein
MRLFAIIWNVWSRTCAATAFAAATALAGAGPASAQEPVKIGFSVSLTGGLASSGKAHLLSKQIWAEEINAKGGLLGRPVRLVYYDDQTNASTVPGIYAKLIDIDKVDLLMGAATNLIVAAMPMIMERKKLIMVLLALGSNAEFKYPKYFQSAPFGPDSKGVLSNAYFEVAKSLNPAPRTVALVGADAEFSNNVLIGARDNAKRFGLQIVYDRAYPPSTVDYTPIVRAIQATNPDVVLLASYPPDSVGMVRAATEVGLKTQLFGGAMVGMQYASLITQLSEKLNRVVNYHFFVPSPKMNFPGIEEFLKKFSHRPRKPASTRSDFINRRSPMRPCRCSNRPSRQPRASTTTSLPPISTPTRSTPSSARSSSTNWASGRARAPSWCSSRTSRAPGLSNT